MNKCRKNKDIREGEKDTGDFYTDFLHNLRVLQSFHSLKDFSPCRNSGYKTALLP
jgi:hypothetical protein